MVILPAIHLLAFPIMASPETRATTNHNFRRPEQRTSLFLLGVRIQQGQQKTDVVEAGDGDIYTVVLTTIPAADVVVTVMPDNQLDVGTGPAMSLELVFTPETALIPQTVFVSAIDDSEFEGDHTGVIAHSIQSADATYAALSLPIIVVNITDNETRYVVINEIDSDTPSVDTMEFIELYDEGFGNTPFDNLVLILFNGSGDTQYAAYDLDGHATDEYGFFLIGSNQIPNIDLLLTAQFKMEPMPSRCTKATPASFCNQPRTS